MNIYWKKEWTTPAAVGVVSFAVGVGVGAFAYRKKIDRDIENGLQMAQDILDTPVFNTYVQVPKSTDIEIIRDGSPAVHMSNNSKEDNELAKKFVDAVDEFTKTHEEPDEPENPTDGSSEPVISNVFEDDWDVAEEMANRGPDAPYVIHVNEFFDRERGLPQLSLEYYAKDKILSDENNVPIYNPEKIVGTLPFGRGSRDPDVVYIRNEKQGAEYAITRNHGSFMEEVHGIEAEAEAEADDLRHSSAIRRFRPNLD